MEALMVTKAVYSDWMGPMYDVLLDIKQLVIERDGSLVVISHIAGRVIVSLVKKDYLRTIRVIETVNIPDDLVERALQEMNTQKQLSLDLQKMNLPSQLSWENLEKLTLQAELMKIMAEFQQKM